MTDAIRLYLPWLLSALTIYSAWLAGGFNRFTWLVGLTNQALWLIWIIATKSWGLLPMNAVLWVIYMRNHWRWASSHPSQHEASK